MIIHVVKQGETLYSIGEIYGVSEDLIAINNGILNEQSIAVGQALIIVIPKTIHTVKSGETLDSIARQYSITVNTLYMNNLILLGSPNISEGMQLIIHTESEPSLGSYMTGGYAYTYITPNLLNETLPFMSGIMPFTYGFTSNGQLVQLDDETIIARAKVYGTKPIMHLSTLTDGETFSPELATSFLNGGTQLWETLTDNVLQNMIAKGYYGLDIDFEFLGKENAIRYAEFIAYTRAKLNQNGYPVIVALAPKTSDTQPGVLYEGHDYKALGDAANAVLLMTYEWGYTYGPPMAVSPIQQVTKVIEYALTHISPEKIFIGISNYGYDFTLPYVRGVSRAPSLSTVEATSLAASRGAEIFYDEEVQAPYFRYYENSTEHIVWFEDVRSINARLSLLKTYGLKGALYWNLNRPNPQNLVLLNSIMTILPFELF